jgi:hypothetical protein
MGRIKDEMMASICRYKQTPEGIGSRGPFKESTFWKAATGWRGCVRLRGDSSSGTARNRRRDLRYAPEMGRR